MNAGTLERGIEAWRADPSIALPRTLYWLGLDSLNMTKTRTFSVGNNGSLIGAQAQVKGYEDIHRFKELGDEKPYLSYFCAVVNRFPNRPQTAIYDIGAESGIFTILAAKILPDATVLPFEPMPRTYRKLLGNIKLNGFSNIHPNEIGLSNTSRTAALYSGGKNCPSLKTLDAKHSSVKTDIQLTTFDELIGAGYPRPYGVKIDVEGSEVEVIEGMEEQLKANSGPAYFFIEAHCQYGVLPQQLSSYLGEYGYLCEMDLTRFRQTEQHLMVFSNSDLMDQLSSGELDENQMPSSCSES